MASRSRRAALTSAPATRARAANPPSWRKVRRCTYPMIGTGGPRGFSGAARSHLDAEERDREVAEGHVEVTAGVLVAMHLDVVARGQRDDVAHEQPVPDRGIRLLAIGWERRTRAV